jgi:hypothetical protein
MNQVKVDEPITLNEWLHDDARPRRKVHGLRFPVVPTGSWLAQVGGAAATLAGVTMLAGVAVALIVGGVASVVVGALREAGKV